MWGSWSRACLGLLLTCGAKHRCLPAWPPNPGGRAMVGMGATRPSARWSLQDGRALPARRAVARAVLAAVT